MQIASLSPPTSSPDRMQRIMLEPPEARAVVSLGSPDLDAYLPWGGLPCDGLHEVRGEGAFGWAYALAGRALAERRGEMLLLGPPSPLNLYPPGLIRFGIAPERVLIAEAKAEKDRLWVLEESLRSGCFAIVVAIADSRDLTASRRLHLAAEAGESMALLLCRTGGASAALTRWEVSSVAGNGNAGWRVSLQRCRGGRPADFIAGWDHDALRLYPTALLGD